MTTTPIALEAFRTEFGCPEWCTSTEFQHREDDPGAPCHLGARIGGLFSPGRAGSEETTVELNPARYSGLNAQDCREIARVALEVAAWLTEQADADIADDTNKGRRFPSVASDEMTTVYDHV